MSYRRPAIFLAVFTAMNIAFVPLLSLYGLRVCPVLTIPGFRFGCYYTGVFVGLVLAFNFAFLFFYQRRAAGQRKLPLVAGIYFLATLGALVVLRSMLVAGHLSTASRAPFILFFASFLLGLTQVYGAAWAWPGTGGSARGPGEESFRRHWLGHVGRTLLPLGVAGGVLLFFLVTQSVAFMEGKTAPAVGHDDLIGYSAYVIYFLVAWLLSTFAFHFLAERDQVALVQAHLDKLGGALTDYRSDRRGTWGLWRAIVDQLNIFSQTMAERTRLLSAFSKFVSEGVAREVISADELDQTGQTKEMTVMMVDVRNFTAMAERLTPAQVVELLNEYFSAMLGVVAQFKVAVDKFIGDGILAYVEGGGGEAAENRAAVEAAFGMLAGLAPLNERLRARGLPEIRIGIGLYRGPLVLGLIGTRAKMQHTIIGDTVNRVARLEGLCKDLGAALIIPGAVLESLAPETRAKFRSFGAQSVKGIAEKIEIYGHGPG